ncbi:hypothetical protein [Kibdelosporangium phytohabitans]|uniref:Uncharacterized protein n=1 Tax=Kibdelosporangium phytohabitans TaxID=860235 RepID=A0A0N9HZN7_9PSEU|nr:hypothetical protein [Kibdelosporangium phytohabitans]ALG09195.1 hypothetical protein AOZ06_21800 [Kibdelosporangium phytohabitans]MBE1469577.1 hypothetical protein [Kibdelosporangium phytohabitans]
MNTLRYETGLNGYGQVPAFEPQPVPQPNVQPPNVQPQYAQQPYTHQPVMPPAPARRGRATIATLIVLASLLLVSTGVFVTLFLMASNDHIDAVARLDDRQQELTGMDGKVRAAESARMQADERNTRLKSGNATMSTCVKAMQHYLWDGLVDAQRTAAARELLTKCR